MRGSGGVTIMSESQRGNAPATPSKMSADEVTGRFGAGSALRSLSGVGHAEIDETTATGGRQTASGDRLEAGFAPPQAAQRVVQRFFGELRRARTRRCWMPMIGARGRLLALGRRVPELKFDPTLV